MSFDTHIFMSIFRQFAEAFYNFDKYPDLSCTKWPKVIAYIILLSFISSLITFIPSFLSYIELEGVSGIIDKYVPDFEIKDGILYSEDKIDYEISNNSMKILLNTDKNFSVSQDMAEKYTTAILADKDKMIVSNFTNVIIYEFKNFSDLSKSDLSEAVPVFQLAVAASIGFVFIFMLFSDILSVVMFSALAAFLNFFVNADVTYSQLFKISVYSRTMPIILRSFLLIFSIAMPNIIYFSVVAVYIYIALKNIKNQNGHIIAVL